MLHRIAHERLVSPACPLRCGEHLLSVAVAQAKGARTLVRRKVGWRRGPEISQRGSALRGFLRDKSRAPSEFLVGALNTHLPLGEGRGEGNGTIANPNDLSS